MEYVLVLFSRTEIHYQTIQNYELVWLAIFWSNVISSDIKADVGSLTETGCVTRGDPGGTGVKSYCWTLEERLNPCSAAWLHRLLAPFK